MTILSSYFLLDQKVILTIIKLQALSYVSIMLTCLKTTSA